VEENGRERRGKESRGVLNGKEKANGKYVRIRVNKEGITKVEMEEERRKI